MKSPLALHVATYAKGCGDQHCPPASRRVVLGKGEIPCDVLFIGEAPGDSENAVPAGRGPNGEPLGKPFCGPAGRVLDMMIARGFEGMKPLKLAYTNVVGCVPLKENKKGQPERDQIKCCQARLADFIKLCDPKLIVAVGEVAETYTDQKMKDSVRFHRPIPVVTIVHPARVLKSPVAVQGLMMQGAEVVLSNAAVDHLQE